MKKSLILASIVTLSCVFAVRTYAQSSEVITDQLVQRCSLAQNYLGDIQKPRDLRTRVSRVQAYQYIYERLDVYTRRLERNSQPRAVELRQQVGALSQDIDVFKAGYEAYDQAREEVVQLKNCRANAASFQAKLNDARVKRQQVNDALVAIQTRLSTDVNTELETVYTQLSSKEPGDSEL